MKKTRILSSSELSVLCLELCYPIEAGLSPADCIGLMLEQTDSAEEKSLLLPAHDALLSGGTLESALEKTGRFPPYMLKMLEIGRISGNLDTILRQLSAHYTRESEREGAISRAVTGPLTLLAVAAALIIVLVTKVLPIFNNILAQMGAVSPLAAALLKGGALARVAAIAAAFAALAALPLFSPRVRERAARPADRLFFGGKLGRESARARFTSAFSVMTAGGIDLDTSLERCALLVSGSEIEKAALDCRELLSKGQSLAKAAVDSGLFTGVDGGILAAGLRGGSLDRAMDELARRQNARAAQMLDRFTSKIEPALVILLSFAVGLVLLSVMLPLLGMLASVGF